MNAAVVTLPEPAPTADELIAELPKYRKALAGWLLRFSNTLSREDLDDLSQEALLAVIVKLRTQGLRDPHNLRSYLYRTALSLTRYYWRKRYRRGTEVDAEVLANAQDDSPGPEETLKREQLARSMRRALAQLPVQRDREVLERLHLREESRVSIRESLGLTDLQFNNVAWRAEGRLALICTNEESLACGPREAARHSWRLHP